MNAVELLREIHAAGGQVVVDNGIAELRASKPLPENVVQLAREHKAELLSLLRDTQAANEPLASGELTEAQAEQLTTAQILGYTPEDVAELDRLINRLCDLVHYSPEARERILSARKRMAPVMVKAELQDFRELVAQAERGEFRWQ